MPTSPTSRDVASAAGVSQSTVSYVLSGKRFVAPETRARVEEAMTELGYQPHASARALKSSKSRILGVVVPYHDYIDAPGQYRYIVSLAAACRRLIPRRIHDHRPHRLQRRHLLRPGR